VLLALRVRLALARRYFRLFRFLESFSAAQKLYASLSAPNPSSSSSEKRNQGQGQEKETETKKKRRRPPPRWTRADIWLDVFGRTFNGMYLLLEALTILDAHRIPGLAPWGPERERALTVEGQRFWLFALVCGVLSGLVKMLKVLAYTPLPAPVPSSTSTSTSGYGFADAGAGGSNAGEREMAKEPTGGEDRGGKGDDGEKEWDLKREQARLRRVVQDHKLRRLAWRREVRSKISALGRRVVSDAVDITLPGSVVGWVNADTGTVGLAMFLTTMLTSMDVWERCGREIAGSKE
jgi:hypothetical protein